MFDSPRADAAASRFLHGYQRFAFTTGPVLALCVLVVVAAAVLRRGAVRLRLDAALLAASVLVMLLVATSLSVFSYRYGLVAALLLPPAAAFAGTALLYPKPSPRRYAGVTNGADGRPSLWSAGPSGL